MAFMIPETIDDIYKVTVGEKKVFKMLKDLLPDSYVVWYEPVINNRCPDFVVLGPDIGLVVLEVKDWSIDYIRSGDYNTFKLITNEVKKNPLKQAKEYAFSIVDKLKQNQYLVENDGLYRGNLIFTYGYGVIFTEILEEFYLNSSIKSAIDPNLIIFKDELNQMLVDYDKEELRGKLQSMFPTTFIFPTLDEKIIDIIINEISGTNKKKENRGSNIRNATNKKEVNNKPMSSSNKNSIALFIGLVAIVILMVFAFNYSDSNKGADIAVDENTANQIVASESKDKENKDLSRVIDIGAINKEMIDETVVIEGMITNIYEHENGHLFLTVEDSTGKILVPIFVDKEISHNMLTTNKRYSFRGRVEEYEGELEIVLETQEDVVLYDIYYIDQITSDLIDEVVVVVAKIIDIYEHENGHLFLTVEDSTGTIQVPIFADKEIDHNMIEINKKYQIIGKIDEYNGELEIIPEEKYDIVEIED